MVYAYLPHSTWRLLGLSVAAAYAGLGLWEIITPGHAGLHFLGITPKASSGADETVRLVCPLLGARDVSIGAALLTFWAQRKDREMGVLILAGTILCTADVAAMVAQHGFGLAVYGTAFGAAIWSTIGWALSQAPVSGLKAD